MKRLIEKYEMREARAKDPADYAKELLATSKNLKKMLERKVDVLIDAMEDADKQVKQLDKLGAGGALGAVEFIKGAVMRRAKELQDAANMVVGELKKTQE